MLLRRGRVFFGSVNVGSAPRGLSLLGQALPSVFKALRRPAAEKPRLCLYFLYARTVCPVDQYMYCLVHSRRWSILSTSHYGWDNLAQGSNFSKGIKLIIMFWKLGEGGR